MSDVGPPDRPGAARRADPLGRRALFSAAPSPEDPEPPDEADHQQRPERRDLFSGPGLGPRSVIVECHRCQARTPVGVAALLRRMVPSVWIPSMRFSRYMRCPACTRFGWCRVDWKAFRPI